MELKFTVSGRISKKIDEVFETVVNPDTLSKFFTTGGAKGRLATGAEVVWDFHDFPGAFPVRVQEVVPVEHEGEDRHRRQRGAGQRQHDLPVDPKIPRAVDAPGLDELVGQGEVVLADQEDVEGPAQPVGHDQRQEGVHPP